MAMDKEKLIEQEMRVLAERIGKEEHDQEDETGTVNAKGNWEKGKLPISPTRMSSNQAHEAQLKFTRVVNDVDSQLKDEGWAVRDGRGKRVAGRSFVMACLTDLMLEACEPMGENPSELRKELEGWKETAMKYIKERRRARDFYPKK